VKVKREHFTNNLRDGNNYKRQERDNEINPLDTRPLVFVREKNKSCEIHPHTAGWGG
jgi:hypothetical protein